MSSLQSIFREYDIRGIFEKELTYESVSSIGYHLGLEIKKSGDSCAVGYDARTHSPVLFEWLTSGLNAAGIRVFGLGLVPTPVSYFACFDPEDSHLPAASIQITGSHNPPEYNGFKITLDQKPFFGEQIYTLGEHVLANQQELPFDASHTPSPVLERYIGYMVREFRHLRGMDSITIDGGNGVVGVAIEPIFRELGIRYEGMYCEPDGTFPNHHPDPSDEENLIDLQAKLTQNGGTGFAFDGDADRLAVLTPNRNIRGDELALIFAKQMENPTIIGEVKCSQVMYDEINKIGHAIMWKTGHSNLKTKLRETGADLAAEVSGHLFFNDRYLGFDDALYGCLRVLELIHQGIDLESELSTFPQMVSTPEINLKTTEAAKFKIIDSIAEILKNPPESFPKILDIITIDGLRIVFEHGWALVRASNTTPKLVTRFEADTDARAKEYETAVMQLITVSQKTIEQQNIPADT